MEKGADFSTRKPGNAQVGAWRKGERFRVWRVKNSLLA
jgi:hypothetical protein